jgi:hypothetical protein
VAPVAATPVTATPAPVTATPTPMSMVVVVPAPPHLLRLEPLDLLSRCHGWMGILARIIVNWRLRQQRSGLRSRGKRSRTGRANSEFQKPSAFHGVPLMSYPA